MFGGDRFILRDETAQWTIGGGSVLYPCARRVRRADTDYLARLEVLRDAGDQRERLRVLLEMDSATTSATANLAAAANLRLDEVLAALGNDPAVRGLPPGDPELFVVERQWTVLREEVAEQIGRFHAEFPRQPGMEMESLRSRVAPAVSAKAYRAMLEALEAEGVLARDGSIVRHPAHETGMGEAEREVAGRIVTALAKARFAPPDTRALSQAVDLPPARLANILADLEREDLVVKVAPDLYYGADAVGTGPRQGQGARHRPR